MLAGGVPGFLTYPVTPLYFIQSRKEVVLTWGQDFQLRHIYLNVPHSPNPRPSWFGESVGHYENGDTLVIDTIGFVEHPLSFVDNYRTPHTKDLHVVERWKLIEGGEWIESMLRGGSRRVHAWFFVQRYRRVRQGTLREQVCAAEAALIFGQDAAFHPTGWSPGF
jgi:hypothetical protein